MNNKLRVLISTVVAVISVFCLCLPICAVKPTNVYVGSLSVSAKSAVLIDSSTNTLLFSKNADTRMPMASTTKIMTALVAIENGDIDAPISISSQAVGIEGSSIYLYEGESLTLRQLLYALLLESANDAAVAIAVEISGNVEEFVREMNRRAKTLDLTDTNFMNPHGLDHENHYTTARELAIITAEALKNELFREIVSTKKTTIPLNSNEGTRLLINHNKMLNNYKGAIGVKTGFTKRSGRCLVSAAERDGLQLIAVTLDAPNDWQDHTNMLNYGFSSFVYINLANESTYRLAVPVSGGKNNVVICTNTQTMDITLPKSHGEITCCVESPRFLLAPIEKGDYIGNIKYYCDGNLIGSSSLIAVSSVESNISGNKLWNFILKLLGLDIWKK